MPDHPLRTARGTIMHVFGHRFVVQTANEAILADVTPHGLAKIKLRIGDRVELAGEQKPTELKVSRFTHGDTTIEIEHKTKHAHHHADADPKVALTAASAAGFETIGAPRRKPKHFEVLGRRDGALTELHVELDGHIRKSKPADRYDPKWAQALSA